MPIKSTGSLGLSSDIVTEFGGDAPHQLSEYRRGNGRVPDIAQNLGIPSSGQTKFSHFYNGLNEIAVTVSNATNITLKNLFDATTWASSVPKKVIITGTVGSTSSSVAAVQTGTGWGGTLKLQVDGSIQGAGGGVGAAGGDALNIQQSGLELINNGTIYGGGGGGGNGGQGGAGGKGGNGSTSSTSTTSETRYNSSTDHIYEGYVCGSGSYKRWGGVNVSDGNGITYTKGASKGGPPAEFVCGAPTYAPAFILWEIVRTATTTTTTTTQGGAGGTGGAGGSGGIGQGYNQTATAGSSGSAGSGGATGGTNAGTGGTGGAGGAGGAGGGWGASGSSGATGNTGGAGANGNASNGLGGSSGSAGGAGGAAGYSIRNRNYATTYVNNGTVLGRI